jgi:hypothetical protein
MLTIALVQRVLWVITTLLEVGILFMLLRNHLRRQVPWFFAYLLLQVTRDVFLGPVSFHPNVFYFYAYWYTEAASCLIGLGLISEIYSQVLEDYASLRRLGILLFRWAVLILLAVSSIVALASTGAENIQLVATILAMESSVRFLQAGLLAFLFMFAKALGLNWRHYVFGIALGMAMFIGTELIVVTIRNHFGRNLDDTFVLLKSAAYLCGVTIWLVFILRPHSQDIKVTPRNNELSELYQWNIALEAYLR